MKDFSSINNYFKSAIKLISAINLAVLNVFLVTSSYTMNGADEWPELYNNRLELHEREREIHGTLQDSYML